VTVVGPTTLATDELQVRRDALGAHLLVVLSGRVQLSRDTLA
jgi:hypothetical protein